jgi:nitroreductase
MIRQFLKRNLPPDWVKGIKSIIKSIEISVLRVFSYNGFTSSLFYSLISNKFHREHRGVIISRLMYEQSLQGNQQPRYLLRRDIHRLEKGLLMRPRKDSFGTLYINETVEAYQNCLNASIKTTEGLDEIKWAHDVLSTYFNIVGRHVEIDKAWSNFRRINESKSFSEDCSRVPYKRDIDGSPPVTYRDFLALTKRRKSVRWYLNQPVPREDIDKAIFAATMSPSACNRQPFEFLIFDQGDMVKRIASLPGGAVGFRDNIPAIAVVLGKLDAFFDERDRHLIYIDSSLAAMAFILSLETMGVSSCAINWPDLKDAEEKMTQTLNLNPNERVIMLIAFGYPDPDGMVAYSQKKPLKELRSYNSR